jgi:hypothetical protein
MLSAVLREREVGSFTSREEEHKLQVFQNEVLRKISGPNNDEERNLKCSVTNNFVMRDLRLSGR